MEVKVVVAFVDIEDKTTHHVGDVITLEKTRALNAVKLGYVEPIEEKTEPKKKRTK